MRLTLRSLLSYLHGQTKSSRTEAIRDTIAASPFLSQLARLLEGLPGQSEISPLPFREKGDGKDPNLVAEYLDYTLAEEAVVRLERQCFQSDRRLLDVVACHQVLASDRESPATDPQLLAELYSLENLEPSEMPLATPQLEARSHRSKKPADRPTRKGIEAQPDARPEPRSADPLLSPTRPRRKRPIGLALLALVAPLTYAGAKWPSVWQPALQSALELVQGTTNSVTTSEQSKPPPFTDIGEPQDESEPPRFVDPMVHRVSAEQRPGASETTRFGVSLDTTHAPETHSPLPAASMRKLAETRRPPLVGRDTRDSDAVWQSISGLPLAGEKTMVVLPDGWFETQWDDGVRIQVGGGGWFRTVDRSHGTAAESNNSNIQPTWHLLTGEFHLLLPPERSVTFWYQDQALQFRSANQPTEIALRTVSLQGAGFDLAQLVDNQTLECQLLVGECQLKTEHDDWLTLSGRRNYQPNTYRLRNNSWEPGLPRLAKPTRSGSMPAETANPPEGLSWTASALGSGDPIPRLHELVKSSDLGVREWANRALITLDLPGPFLQQLGDMDASADFGRELDHLIDRMQQHPEFARTVRSELASLYPGTGFSVYRLLCGYPADDATDELIEQLSEIETRGLPQLSRVARYQLQGFTTSQSPSSSEAKSR